MRPSLCCDPPGVIAEEVETCSVAYVMVCCLTDIDAEPVRL